MTLLMSRSMRVHLSYCAVIGVLLIIAGARYVPLLWEQTATIPGGNNKSTYRLRMLSSGNLIVEGERGLPLASYQDYWGDMSVSTVQWSDDRRAMIMMSDGTKLEVTLGAVKVTPPTKSPPR
jgi:hypothetical protein